MLPRLAWQHKWSPESEKSLTYLALLT